MCSLLNAVACIGCGTAVFSLVPQIVRSYRTKSVEDISSLMLWNLTVSSLSWTWYGAMIDDVPMLLTNALLVVGSCIMLVLKVKYRSNPKNGS